MKSIICTYQNDLETGLEVKSHSELLILPEYSEHIEIQDFIFFKNHNLNIQHYFMTITIGARQSQLTG